MKKKDGPQRLFVSHVIDCKNRSHLNAQKPRVRTLMDSQHFKGSETLLKSAWQYFCDLF